MRILVNSWRDLAHPQAGGSEYVVDDVARELAARDHEVVVRCGGPLARHDDYRVVAGGGTYTQYLRTPLDLRRHGRHCDVVLDVNNGMGFYSPLWTSLPSVGLVHHVHTEQWPMFFGPLVSRLGRAQEHHLMPFAYRDGLMVATSPSTVQSLAELGVPADRIRLLPLRASLAPTGAVRAPEPMFVACGRLTSHKRYDLLLRLWERARPMVGGRLVIIGDGPERTNLEALAGEGVEFVGSVDEETKAALLHQAWVLLHTAPWEGWGLVITEAGLARTPSVGFDVKGVRDAIRHGDTGLLAAHDDAFVEAWVALTVDHELRSCLGSRAESYAMSLTEIDRAAIIESVLAESIEIHRGHQRSRATRFPSGRPTLGVAGADDRVVGAVGVGAPGRMRALSIVIPAYDEEARIGGLLEELPCWVDLETTEVIVVDDGSADATSTVATEALAAFAHAQVIRLPENQGKGAALRSGVASARGRKIVFMDADGATDLAGLAPLVDALDRAHVAIGTRATAQSTVTNGQRHRRYMAAGFRRFVQTTSALRVSDSQCGFKGFRGPVARLLFHLTSVDRFAQDVELLLLASELGFEVAEVPVRWTAIEGSKVAVVRDSARMARDVAAMRLRTPAGPIVRGLTVGADPGSSAIIAKEVASCLRATDPVLDDGTEVHILLPGVAGPDVSIVVERIASAIGDREIATWTVDARSMRRLGEGPVQDALCAIGNPLD